MYFIGFQINWSDADLIAINITTMNDCFSAKIEVYTTSNELATISKDLSGFPRSSNEVLSFSIGIDDYHGKFSFTLSMFNGTGRCKMDVNLISSLEGTEKDGVLKTAVILEPAEIDSFSNALSAISKGNIKEFYMTRNI